MPMHYQLQIEIDEINPPTGVVGLLVPVPPTTPHQTLRKVVLDPSWEAASVISSAGVQAAIYAIFPKESHQSTITFELTDAGRIDHEHFTKAEHTTRHFSDDVYALANEVGVDQCTCDTERLEKIVETLASKFQYQSGFSNNAPLTCDILTGNCLSINEAFLKLAKVANIPSAYYIGYFFESDQTLKSKDWHCWVSTLTTQGFDSWDIAHHLKRGMHDVQSGLNPVPGTRFATCVGRNLVFQLPVGQVTVPHLCEPRWIFEDGGSKPCEIKITLRVCAEMSNGETDISASKPVHAGRMGNQPLVMDSISTP